MSSERVERRLTAVLAADVAGYSRMMGRDEEATLAQLKSIRKALVDPAIDEHHGRIVKTTGDGMLVEFASAVERLVAPQKFARDGSAERRLTAGCQNRISRRHSRWRHYRRRERHFWRCCQHSCASGRNRGAGRRLHFRRRPTSNPRQGRYRL